MAMLVKDFASDSRVAFLDVAKRQSGFAKILRPLKIVMRLSSQCMSLEKKGRVLLFSSAYMSFWEKLVWAEVIRWCNRRAIILMVDGNFPDFYSRLSSFSQWLARRQVRKLEVLGVQSAAWQKYYRSIFPGANIQIVSAGIDTDFFSPSVREDSPRGVLKLLYVGWLIEPKGLYDLLDAAQILRANNLRFVLRLVGPAFGQEQTISAELERRQLSDSVVLVGPVGSRQVLLEEYRSADVFIFPSHFEGFPFAVLEAISVGMACVGSAVGGVPDILADGDCGVLIQPKRPEEIAAAVMQLAGSPATRQALRTRARDRAVAHYSLARSLESYREALCINQELS
jgi:glycosyltransferase involved in cell wall biosynthesis